MISSNQKQILLVASIYVFTFSASLPFTSVSTENILKSKQKLLMALWSLGQVFLFLHARLKTSYCLSKLCYLIFATVESPTNYV